MNMRITLIIDDSLMIAREVTGIQEKMLCARRAGSTYRA